MLLPNGYAQLGRCISQDNIFQTGCLTFTRAVCCCCAADWGASRQINVVDGAISGPAFSYCTSSYRAPELWISLLRKKQRASRQNVKLHYNRAVDLWSLGVVICEMVFGVLPFEPAQPNDKEPDGKQPDETVALQAYIKSGERYITRQFCLSLSLFEMVFVL